MGTMFTFFGNSVSTSTTQVLRQLPLRVRTANTAPSPLNFFLTSKPRNLFVALFVRGRRSLLLSATFVNFVTRFARTPPKHYDSAGKAHPKLKFFMRYVGTKGLLIDLCSVYRAVPCLSLYR